MGERHCSPGRRLSSAKVVVVSVVVGIALFSFAAVSVLFSREEQHLAWILRLLLDQPTITAMLFMLRDVVLAAGAVAVAAAAPLGQSSSSSSTLLYVSSYAGTITTLNLSVPGSGVNATGASLNAISSSTGCAPNPSWLTLDYPNSLLYCADEGFTSPNGTLSSYKTSPNGTLVQLDKVDTLSGPVSTVIYGPGGAGLAVAEYSGSAISAYSISNPATLALLQSETFTIPRPGPNPSRQEAPHPHEAILDPTGRFLIVPDLGADLVRVFALNQSSLLWTAVTPLTAPPGSGPRHAAFLVAGNKTVLYVVSELANTVAGYDVTYNANSTLSFDRFYLSGTHGEGNTVPSGAAAAEVHLSPDNKFLIVSSRLEANLTIPNFDPKNSTQIKSDSLITFAVDHQTGNLTLVQRFPSGGLTPRQFSINKAGTLLGVGLQDDSRVVVINRDTKTGLLKGFLANATIDGQITSVVFNE